MSPGRATNLSPYSATFYRRRGAGEKKSTAIICHRDGANYCRHVCGRAIKGWGNVRSYPAVSGSSPVRKRILWIFLLRKRFWWLQFLLRYSVQRDVKIVGNTLRKTLHIEVGKIVPQKNDSFEPVVLPLWSRRLWS